MGGQSGLRRGLPVGLRVLRRVLEHSPVRRPRRRPAQPGKDLAGPDVAAHHVADVDAVVPVEVSLDRVGVLVDQLDERGASPGW